MRRISAVVGVLLFVIGLSGADPRGAQDTFFSQAAQARIDSIAPETVSYMLVDVTSGDLLASRWQDPEKSAPVGSLVKPFLALAYGASHHNQFPTVECKGEASGCWRPSGHGRMHLREAIAQSCNAYFLRLASDVNRRELERVVESYGVGGIEKNMTPRSMFGADDRWQMTPRQLTEGYRELWLHRDEEVVSELLKGMAGAASEGTAELVQRGLPVRVLAKTGTAPCEHATRAAGDGFVVAFLPADAPRLLLVVRQHGVPGAKAAATAGAMLQSLEGSKANAD